MRTPGNGMKSSPALHFIPPLCYFSIRTGGFSYSFHTLPYAIFQSLPALYFILPLRYFSIRTGGFSYSFHSPHTLFQSLPALYFILSLRYFSIHRVLFHIYYHSSLCDISFLPCTFFSIRTGWVLIFISFTPHSISILASSLSHSFPALFFNPPGAFSYI